MRQPGAEGNGAASVSKAYGDGNIYLLFEEFVKITTF
jgi:hypothetical protein